MTPDELRRLLETYFEGPISDTHIDKLAVEIRRMTAERTHLGGLISGMTANSRNFAGQLWRETLARKKTTPKLELAAVYAAASQAGYPRPKPYCPDTLAGAWRQITPGAATWQLAATGTFKSDDARLSDYTGWATHRTMDHDLIGSAIRVSHKNGDMHSMVIFKHTPNELEVEHIAGAREKVRYSLTRGQK